MNDKIIINTISKIHFILLSALSFIFLILFTMFILLQNGIYIDDISLQNIKAKKLYIKWDEKISVFAEELNITKDKKSKDSQTDYKQIIKAVEKALLFGSWFETIAINKISFNEINGSFKYTQNEEGYMSLSSPEFLLNTSLHSTSNLLNIEILEFKSRKKDIKIQGHVVLDYTNALELTTSLNIDINNDAKLHLYINADTKKLSYKLTSDGNIYDTKYIVDIFDIDQRAKYWFYDAMELSSLSINALYGWFEYKNMDKAYLNLHAKAVANDLVYTYDTQVASVRTSHTDLEFKDGILFIKPKNAYSYNFFLDKSWLKIDFSKKEELLTLYLLFKGQANKDLLTLLNRYTIKLPFVQTKGELDCNLKLDINLISADVTALGNFYTKEAQINYLGLSIDIFDANISINNSHVKVNNMFAKYKDIAASHVDLDFHAKESSGTLDFRLKEVSLKEYNLALDKSSKPLHVSYKISPKQDYITVNESSWEFKDKQMSIEAMEIPFDMEKLSAQIPVTAVEIQTMASAYVSGIILFNPNKINLDIDLLKLNYSNVSLTQSVTPLKLLYDKKLTIFSKNSVRLNVANKELLLNNIVANIENKNITLKNLKLDINNILKSKISAQYNLNSLNGFIDIHSLEIADGNFGEIFKSDKETTLHISNSNNKTIISSKEYDLEYILSDEEWRLNLNSIEKIAKNSKIFQKYSLDNGYFSVYQKNNEKNIRFLANTDYEYKILSTKEKPIDNYIVKGEIEANTNDLSLNINDFVDIKIKDDIKIEANNTGININEIIDMFADMNSTKSTKDKKNVSLDAKNCFIYLAQNRNVISDDIKLQYFNNILTAQLIHKQGNAGFNLNDNKFNLYGKDFNDEFMGNLFALSKFKDGSLNFTINGTLKEYEGIIFAKNTTVKDYKILNNILAFVNTVPSLVTFSLPGYSRKGLNTQSAYINFKFKDDVYKMSAISLKSKEIEIAGRGEASIDKNSINLDLNLKTDLGSAVSKIPIVGYILLGKDNISTSLSITGALDNPDVNTQVARDIMVAPLNIIKRTLMLPFELFKSGDKEK